MPSRLARLRGSERASAVATLLLRQQREDAESRPLFCADALPKLAARAILVKDEQVAFLDPLRAQREQRVRNERATEPFAAMRRGDSKVMNQTATPVVPTKNGRYDDLILDAHEAESRIPPQKSRNIVERICTTQADACGRVPERERLRVVVRSESANLDCHLSPPRNLAVFGSERQGDHAQLTASAARALRRSARAAPAYQPQFELASVQCRFGCC